LQIKNRAEDFFCNTRHKVWCAQYQGCEINLSQHLRQSQRRCMQKVYSQKCTNSLQATRKFISNPLWRGDLQRRKYWNKKWIFVQAEIIAITNHTKAAHKQMKYIKISEQTFLIKNYSKQMTWLFLNALILSMLEIKNILWSILPKWGRDTKSVLNYIELSFCNIIKLNYLQSV